MATVRRVESGVVFEVDASAYADLESLQPRDTKTCEFVWQKIVSGRPVVCFVEAKSSAPRLGSVDDFRKWVADVARKFEHSILFWLATALGRHPPCCRAGFPHALLSPDALSGKVMAVVVLPELRKEALSDVSLALQRALRPFAMAAGVERTVAVLNRETAQRYGYIAKS